MGQTTHLIPPVWARLWAAAILAHVIANPRFGALVPNGAALGVSMAVLVASAVALAIRPGSQVALAVTNIAVIVVVVLEAPAIGNHWLLACVVAVAILIAMAGRHEWDRFAPVGRWLMLAFYLWAGFAKLNSAFFDPQVSCGLEFANQTLQGWGLPIVEPTSAWAWAPILGTALIELSIPWLLIASRTRTIGVVLALVFHGVVSLNLIQAFYSFTGLLIPLVVLFLSGEELRATERWVRKDAVRVWALLAGVVGLIGFLPAGNLTINAVRFGGYALWVPFLLWIVVTVVRVSRVRSAPDEDQLRLKTASGIALVAIVAAIGAFPYLEVRTATSWNMYANLETVAGSSNHYLIRSTLALTDHQERLVIVHDTDDPGLQWYPVLGYAPIERHFLDYLARHPDANVDFEVDGTRRVAVGRDIGEPLNWFERRFQLFRSVDLESPTRCQRAWLPAG
jgi:hypothetical protein